MVEVQSISLNGAEGAESTGAGNDFLMGSILDQIKATIVYAVHWESMNTIIIVDTVANTIRRTDNVQWDDLGFRDGDGITIVGSGGSNDGNYTISKLQSSTGYGTAGEPKNIDQLLLVGALSTTGTYAAVDIHGTTSVNWINFYFNLIPNDASESYLSLTDNISTQKKKTGTVTWTVVSNLNLSNATNSDGWDTSSIVGVDTIEKTAIINYAQIFTIVHYFTISPLFLSGQQDSLVTLLNGKTADGRSVPPPSYFEDINSLKYIAKVEAKFTDADPKIVHISNWFSSNNPYGLVSDKPGNVGWFNEFLNGGSPEYTLTSVSYVDNATALPLPRIDLNKQTDVTINIHSKSGNFTNKGAALGSQILLSMIYCPLDEKDYINTSTDLLTNFKQDRKLTTLGALSVNGEQFGTDLQALTNILATFTNANNAVVTFSVIYSAATKAFLKLKDPNNRYYLISVTPQKKTVTKLAETDRNAILCDFQTADWNRDDSTQLVWVTDTLFYQYPDTSANPKTDLKLFIGDTSIAKSQMKIKIGSELTNLIVTIQAYNSGTGETQELEKYTYDFQGLFDQNNKIVIPIETNRDFKLATDNERNIISFFRVGAIDDASHYGYEMDYAFKLRYEEWRLLPSFNKSFTQNPTENWAQYSKAPGWQIQFVLTANVYDPTADYTTTFIRTANATIKDSTDSSDGFGGTITTKITTSVFVGAGYNDAGGLILDDDITHVTATCTGNFAAFPVGVDAYYGILSLDVEGQGGINFVDETSTDVDLLSSSLWIAKPTLTKVSATTITVEGDIDYTKLDLKQNRYLIYARLGFKKL